MSSCDRLFKASCTRFHNSAMVVTGSGETVSSPFTMSHTCSIGERSGNLTGQCSCCTLRRARCVAEACVDMRCPAEKHDSSTGLNYLCNVECTMKPEGVLRVVDESFRKMLTRSKPNTCTSISRIQIEPTLNRAPFHSPVDSFTTPEQPCLAVKWCTW